MTDNILQDLPEQTFIAAIEENLFAFLPYFRLLPQAEVQDEPEILWSLTNIPFPLCNSVVRARLAPNRVDAVIQAAIERCRERKVPMLWWTGPTTQPADLGSRLVARGFSQHELPGMAMDLRKLNSEQPSIPGLKIELVRDAENAKVWCDTIVAGFEMPDFVGDAFLNLINRIGFDSNAPLQNYFAIMEGKPVATSSVFYGAGVAGIYNVATLPDARGKGIGAEITRAPVCDARALGYRVAMLHSSPIGFNIYRRLGFQEYCKIGHHIWAREESKRAA